MSAPASAGSSAPNGVPSAAIAQYLTSRDAAALLGVPEPDVRRLIRDGTLAGFRAGGYWIVRGEAVARYGASAEGAMARLRTDYPGWRIEMLSRCFFAIAGIGAGGPAAVVFAATVDGVRRELERWHADRLKMRRNVAWLVSSGPATQP